MLARAGRPLSLRGPEEPRETIVYTTLRPPNQDIYLVDPAEEGPRRLTDHLGLDYNATFTPDGRWLVFTSERRVVLDTDSLPAWATSTCRRDGRIAFNTGPDFAPVDAPVDVWTVRPDGTGLKNLTNDETSNDAFPVWSADCEHIVFRSGRDGNKEIYIMEDDGTDPRRLTRHPATETAPAISPDGEWVVFATGRDHTTAEDAEDLVPISRQGRGGGAGFRLWIQRLDGTEGRFLEPDLVGVPGRDMHPQFSPDGKRVLFISGRGGINGEFLLAMAPQAYGELWAIPVEGGRAVRLTHDKWEDGLARWGVVDSSRQ